MHPDLDLDDYTLNAHAATDDAPEPIMLQLDSSLQGLRFDQALARVLPDYSRNRLQQWIEAGHILLDGAQVSVKQKVWGGEYILIQPQWEPEQLAYKAEALPLDVVYEDESVLVLNKPAGLVVHPAAGHWSGTLLNGLLHAYPELMQVPRAGIVHRLDKDTSGLMVVARTLQAHTHLVRQLQARTVKRHYQAIVEGILPEEGTINAPVGRHPSDRVRMAVVATGKEAITHYETLGWFRLHTLVCCKLETGRTHQIRVHMQHLGHPLLADPVYNSRARSSSPFIQEAARLLARQALHAWRLELTHPLTGASMAWETELPADMQAALEQLNQDYDAYVKP